MFKCCNGYHKGKFIYRFSKPVYRVLEYGICPNCGQRHFIDYKQVLEGEDNFKEVMKTFKGEAAQKEFNKWKQRLNNSYQGTFSKEFFYYGTFKEEKNGYYKTYRTNFNNKKEFLFKDKIKTFIM